MTVERPSPLSDYTAKLDRRRPLPTDAGAAFEALPHIVVRAEPGEIISEEGSKSTRSFFVSSGFVSRQKKAGATKQIVGVGITGDAVDLQSLWFDVCDHSIVAHTQSTLITVEHGEIIALCEKVPAIGRALWHDTLVESAIFREWALNVGHRPAKLRIGHFLLEIATRLKAHNVIEGDTFELPLTQTQLASAMGLSLVHTNKSLKALRADQLVLISGRQVVFLDRARLEQLSGFDAAYLHIDTAPKF